MQLYTLCAGWLYHWKETKFWQKQFIDASISRVLDKWKNKNKLIGSPTNSSQKTNAVYIYIYIYIYSLFLGEIFRESKYQWRFNNYNTNDLKALHATPIYTCNFILYILAGCTFGTDCQSSEFVDISISTCEQIKMQGQTDWIFVIRYSFAGSVEKWGSE